jgi:hypothetical protein
VAEQVDPQLIWLELGGLEVEVTDPCRRPVFVTLRLNVCTVKVAVTDFAAFTVTVQVAAETVSHPSQLVKFDPVAGVAVKVTTVPLSK